MTTEQLRAIMPRLSDKRNGELLPFLSAAMAEFGIEGPRRAAAFLAQLAHESGEFRFMEEIWGLRMRSVDTSPSRSCRRRLAIRKPATVGCSRDADRFS